MYGMAELFFAGRSFGGKSRKQQPRRINCTKHISGHWSWSIVRVQKDIVSDEHKKRVKKQSFSHRMDCIEAFYDCVQFESKKNEYTLNIKAKPIFTEADLKKPNDPADWSSWLIFFIKVISTYSIGSNVHNIDIFTLKKMGVS